MVFYSQALKDELNKELIEKSIGAAPGFFMMAAWILYRKFETTVYGELITALAIGLMISALLRYIISFLFNRKTIDLRMANLLTTTNILLNGLVLAVTLMIPIIEYRFERLGSSAEVVAIVLAPALASMVSVAYNIRLAYALQWIIAVPPAAYLFYLWQSGSATALPPAVIFTITVIYLLQQTRRVHNEVVRRISYAIDLETSNKLLLVSQDLLIQEKAKLQHSIKLAAVGEISAEIAHEINNPLGIIMGYIELSLDSVKSPSPDFVVLHNQLTKAKSAISRITKIIKGLRHYSRRTNDDPVVPVYVNEIIEDAVEFCSEKFNYNKTQLEIENPTDYKLLCRPIEISQVMLNIFSNGIDEVSKLDLEMRVLRVRVLASDNNVRIQISNLGPKIRPEIQEKLFEPFFSTKKRGIGTGLGLSISRGIIESYKGRLYYDSAQEHTTFVIELPQYLLV